MTACQSAYLTPHRRDEDPALVSQRDIADHLPDGLEGTYYFGGGFLGGDEREPQSTLVELDAGRGRLRRTAFTYKVNRGKPFTDLGGSDAQTMLSIVHRIAGRVHKVVAAPQQRALLLCPTAGAPAIVNADTLRLEGSFGERVFFADNFSAHPLLSESKGELIYTRLNVLDNLEASMDGAPERYEHTLFRRDLQTAIETPVGSPLSGTIVHAVERSWDGSVLAVVFTGDGIRKPFGRDDSGRGPASAAHSRVVLLNSESYEVLADIKTAAVPVHLEFGEPRESGEHPFYVQCVNTTFVDDPPTWYGYGSYQKFALRGEKVTLEAEYNEPSTCNLPHSMRLLDDGRCLVSTNAESRLLLGLDPRDLSVLWRAPFEALSPKHDAHPRGLEQSVDGRYLLVSSNTAVHFFDLRTKRWTGRPIGVVIGQRHAHVSRQERV